MTIKIRNGRSFVQILSPTSTFMQYSLKSSRNLNKISNGGIKQATNVEVGCEKHPCPNLVPLGFTFSYNLIWMFLLVLTNIIMMMNNSWGTRSINCNWKKINVPIKNSNLPFISSRAESFTNAGLVVVNTPSTACTYLRMGTHRRHSLTHHAPTRPPQYCSWCKERSRICQLEGLQEWFCPSTAKISPLPIKNVFPDSNFLISRTVLWRIESNIPATWKPTRSKFFHIPSNSRKPNKSSKEIKWKTVKTPPTIA